MSFSLGRNCLRGQPINAGLLFSGPSSALLVQVRVRVGYTEKTERKKQNVSRAPNKTGRQRFPQKKKKKKKTGRQRPRQIKNESAPPPLEISKTHRCGDSASRRPGDHLRTRGAAEGAQGVVREDGGRGRVAAAEADDGLHPSGGRREGRRDRGRRRRGIRVPRPSAAHSFLEGFRVWIS